MNSNKYTIDRFEGEWAVLLKRDDETVEKIVPKHLLGGMASEGDILLIAFNDSGEVIKSDFLKEETEQARKQTEALLEKLKHK